MQVLVCDDDAATRFVIKRVLIHATGCQVSECANGIEALQMVTSTHVDLMVLDIRMPTLDGLEVLEELRSGEFKSLPVIVLTSERREDVVRKLIAFGILGYVLKPLSHERLLPLTDRARALAETLARESEPIRRDSIRLDPHACALLIDGSSAYRELFVTHAERYGRVDTADSGLEGLARVKRSPTRLVFVGHDLGAIDADVVGRKLRTMSAGAPLRLVAVRDSGADGDPPPGYDDVVQRVTLPAAHEELMRRFLPMAGPLSGLIALVGDLRGIVSSSAIDVFGLALDSHVDEVRLSSYRSDWRTTVDIAIPQRFIVTVDLHASTSDARAIAARLLALESDAVEEGDVRASTSELVGLLVSRLHPQLGGTAAQWASPRVEFHAPALIDESQDAGGLWFQFRVTDIGATVAMVVRVENEREGADPVGVNEPAA